MAVLRVKNRLYGAQATVNDTGRSTKFALTEWSNRIGRVATPIRRRFESVVLHLFEPLQVHLVVRGGIVEGHEKVTVLEVCCRSAVRTMAQATEGIKPLPPRTIGWTNTAEIEDTEEPEDD